MKVPEKYRGKLVKRGRSAPFRSGCVSLQKMSLENDRHGVTETLTDRMAGGTSPGVLSPVSRTFGVAVATIWKFVPGRGGCGLPSPNPVCLRRLVGQILSSRVTSLMS
jgi:hypothetical protein